MTKREKKMSEARREKLKTRKSFLSDLRSTKTQAIAEAVANIIRRDISAEVSRELDRRGYTDDTKIKIDTNTLIPEVFCSESNSPNRQSGEETIDLPGHDPLVSNPSSGGEDNNSKDQEGNPQDGGLRPKGIRAHMHN